MPHNGLYKNKKNNYENMETLKTIWNFLFNHRTICGKQWIEDSMTEKYGEDWLEQCIEGLKDPSVRADLKETLKL